MIKKILIVEDDIAFGTMLQSWFNKDGFEAVLASTVSSAKKELMMRTFNIMLTDLRLPDGDGILLLQWMKEEKKLRIPVIIMTSYGDVQHAVAAMKLGAFDFLEKPVNPSILKQKIEQALAAANNMEKKQHPAKVSNPQDFDFIEGKSIVAKQLQDYIMLVAPTKMTVLIKGESGTGKEYTARSIHKDSLRKDMPFIAVDCGSLSSELAASELFGHMKGSFTSAIADKKGVFEQADKGTVFLDEVGNLSYEVQVQLLRALQEQTIRPVGSVQDIKVDVRIIAATNENLENAIKNGRFREDLYHRLNEFSLQVPSLRERISDLPIYAVSFLEKANEELGKNVKGFTKDALKMLENYTWNGNLRELKNVVRRAVLFAKEEEITPEYLPVLIDNSIVHESPTETLILDNERQRIEIALKKAGGNKSLAAKMLQIDRKTLYNKIHQYGMDL